MKRLKTCFAFASVLIILFNLNACESQILSLQDDNMKAIRPLESEAMVNHSRLTVELPRNLWLPCSNGGAGEWALGSGVIHLTEHETSTDNGYMYRFHINHSRITGVGEITGVEVVGQFVENYVEVEFAESGLTVTRQLHIHGVTKGSVANWFIPILMHGTLNANGELSVFFESNKSECRG